MDNHTATELAYKNGYEQGKKDAVRHGRWIWKGDDKGWFCSECGSGCLLNMESDWFKSDGCPHCRAKMDGDTE